MADPQRPPLDKEKRPTPVEATRLARVLGVDRFLHPVGRRQGVSETIRRRSISIAGISRQQITVIPQS